MNDYSGGLEEYLNQELNRELDRRREEIEITEVIEDLPRNMSESLDHEKNINRITLATSKGRITLEVTDQWREAILDGRVKRLIIADRESDLSVLTVMLSHNGSLDYSGYGSGRQGSSA